MTSAIYMSPAGSDTNSGSASAPVASMAEAAALAHRAGVSTVYMEGGTYWLMSKPASLGSTADGITFQTDPSSTTEAVLDARGVEANDVVLNGASNVTLQNIAFHGATSAAIDMVGGSGNGVVADYFESSADAVLVDGSTYATLSGNQVGGSGDGVAGYTASGFELKDGAAYATIDSNLIDGGDRGSAGTGGGAVYLHGADDATITHNQIQNTGGAGINLADFDQHDSYTQNSGAVIADNKVMNTNQESGSGDSGAIYILGRSLANTGDTVSTNIVSGTGTNTHDEGVYLDDNATGVTVSANIISGVASNSDATEIHGGSGDTFSGNIFDLGSSGSTAGMVQGDEANQPNPNSLKNDSYTANVVASDGSPASDVWAFLSGATPGGVSGNDYWDYTGAPVNAYPDSSARYVRPSSSYSGLDSTSGDGIGFTQISQSSIGLHPATAHWY